MDDSDILPRRLSAAGCRLAGAQLTTQVAALKKNKKVKLPRPGHRGAHQRRRAGHDGPSGDERRTRFRCSRSTTAPIAVVAGFAGALAGIAKCYHAEADIVPLTPAESQRAEAASRVIGAPWPWLDGFHQEEPNRLQFDAIAARGHSARSIEEQGRYRDARPHRREGEAQRFVNWTEVYGAAAQDHASAGYGRLAAKPQCVACGVGSAIDRRARKYRDPKSEEQDALVRQELLSPYDNQVQAERDAQAQTDARRAAVPNESTTPPAAPPKPPTAPLPRAVVVSRPVSRARQGAAIQRDDFPRSSPEFAARSSSTLDRPSDGDRIEGAWACDGAPSKIPSADGCGGNNASLALRRSRPLVAALDSDLRDAIADVDLSLVRLSLAQSPWDRLRSASRMAGALSQDT